MSAFSSGAPTLTVVCPPPPPGPELDAPTSSAADADGYTPAGCGTSVPASGRGPVPPSALVDVVLDDDITKSEKHTGRATGHREQGLHLKR